MSSDPKGNQAIPASAAVPNSNTLLAYKLLSDSWKADADNPFATLMKDEMKYLVSGISLLQNDPYLQVKLGGVSLNNAGYLADALKSKVAELEIQERIEPNARQLLDAQYTPEQLQGLAPGKETVQAGEGGVIKIATTETGGFDNVNPGTVFNRKGRLSHQLSGILKGNAFKGDQ